MRTPANASPTLQPGLRPGRPPRVDPGAPRSRIVSTHMRKTPHSHTQARGLQREVVRRDGADWTGLGKCHGMAAAAAALFVWGS